MHSPFPDATTSPPPRRRLIAGALAVLTVAAVGGGIAVFGPTAVPTATFAMTGGPKATGTPAGAGQTAPASTHTGQTATPVFPGTSPYPAQDAVGQVTVPPVSQDEGTQEPAELYRPPSARVLDWIQQNADDPRSKVLKERLADVPQAAWLTQHNPKEIAGEVSTLTSDAAAKKQVPVLVAYNIPNRDCGNYSAGGAPDLAAYDTWINGFASGLGDSEVIVILEPDAVSLSLNDCMSGGDRQARYDALAKATQTLKGANAKARVYMDGGHSGWHPAETQAAALRAAGAEKSDGVFSNVANFHTTPAETAYTRKVLDGIGGTGLGAVIDTSRNGNGAPEAGEWCDPAGRALGQKPTLATGEQQVDAYLWIKLPGEADGCKAKPGDFLPDYAVGLATNAQP